MIQLQVVLISALVWLPAQTLVSVLLYTRLRRLEQLKGIRDLLKEQKLRKKQK